jgi:integrase
MTRRYRYDYLTINRSKSKNWMLNFRVPESHRNQPPFVGRETYQCSTKTPDSQEACRFRDAFFKGHGLFGFSDEASPAEIYWKTFSGDERISDEERELLQVVVEDTVGLGSKLPETYASRIAGDRNREQSLREPLATIQHQHPLHLVTLHDEYLNYRSSDFAAKTVSRSRRAMRTFNEFMRSDTYDFSSVKKTLVFKYVQYLERKSLHETTIRGYLTSLGQVFDYAQRLGYITDERLNPFKEQRVRSVKRDEKPRTMMPLEYARGLYAQAPTDELSLLVAIGHYTGVRISEAYSATTEHIDGYMSLRVADNGGKTRAATRQIPLHDQLRVLISESPLFDGSVGRIQWLAPNSDSLGKRFTYFKRRYFRQLGVDDSKFVFHSFRHAFSTYLVNEFGELKASELTGHGRDSVSATELGRTYYGGLSMTEKWALIEKIPNLI